MTDKVGEGSGDRSAANCNITHCTEPTVSVQKEETKDTTQRY